MDLHRYTTFHLKTTEYPFFSNAPRIFSRKDHDKPQNKFPKRKSKNTLRQMKIATQQFRILEQQKPF